MFFVFTFAFLSVFAFAFVSVFVFKYSRIIVNKERGVEGRTICPLRQR